MISALIGSDCDIITFGYIVALRGDCVSPITCIERDILMNRKLHYFSAHVVTR